MPSFEYGLTTSEFLLHLACLLALLRLIVVLMLLLRILKKKAVEKILKQLFVIAQKQNLMILVLNLKLEETFVVVVAVKTMSTMVILLFGLKLRPFLNLFLVMNNCF